MGTSFTLIRHGKTAGNYEKRYIGITDEQMTLDGENEIRVREYPKADIVFSSPLARCLRSAKIIYPSSEIIIVDELRETDFGLFEGKNYKDLAQNPQYISWMESGGEDAFPGGESRGDAIQRTMKGFDLVLEKSKNYRNVSVIAHGGTIMAILSELFGGEYYSYHVENCEGYTFDLSFDGVCSGLCPRSFLRGSN